MIDARGYSCPMPVVMVQKEMKKEPSSVLTVLVDDKTAVGNVTRFANGQGYQVSIRTVDDDFELTLTKEDS